MSGAQSLVVLAMVEALPALTELRLAVTLDMPPQPGEGWVLNGLPLPAQQAGASLQRGPLGHCQPVADGALHMRRLPNAFERACTQLYNAGSR